MWFEKKKNVALVKRTGRNVSPSQPSNEISLTIAFGIKLSDLNHRL